MDEPEMPPPGWFEDPTEDSQMRWWTGREWSADTRPVATAPAESTPTAPRKVPLFGVRRFAREQSDEIDRLRRLIEEYGLLEVDARQQRLSEIEAEIESNQSHLRDVWNGVQDALRQRRLLEAELVDMRDAVDLQTFGIFGYEHPAENSTELASQLEQLRADIKDAIRKGRATTASSNFTFNNSAAKGRKFVSDMSKLLLRAYNAEAENCVKSVRAGNLEAALKRLRIAESQVEQLGKMIDLQITRHYAGLRRRELELANRHLQALKAEKEMERARREELREQRLAEQELAREKERLEKERAHYFNVLASLQSSGDEEGAARTRAKLEDVEKAIEDVDYRAANIRAGYVYVISNAGAFGPDVVKIGLTRRLEPMDRINELGDASVPFRFDVHALFFSADAVSIEAMLHQHFAEQRINKVNLRREYFRTTPSQVLEVLKQHDVEVLEFALEVANEEYLASRPR